MDVFTQFDSLVELLVVPMLNLDSVGSNTVGRRSVALAAGALAGHGVLSSARACSPFAPTLRLLDGTELPLVTWGVQIYPDSQAQEATLRALECGFRSFFTSPEAGNQEGFARAIRESRVPREELFLAGACLPPSTP